MSAISDHNTAFACAIGCSLVSGLGTGVVAGLANNPNSIFDIFNIVGGGMVVAAGVLLTGQCIARSGKPFLVSTTALQLFVGSAILSFYALTTLKDDIKTPTQQASAQALQLTR